MATFDRGWYIGLYLAWSAESVLEGGFVRFNRLEMPRPGQLIKLVAHYRFTDEGTTKVSASTDMGFMRYREDQEYPERYDMYVKYDDACMYIGESDKCSDGSWTSLVLLGEILFWVEIGEFEPYV